MFEEPVAVVVPTVAGREETFANFMKKWKHLFEKYEVYFIKVVDGENPTANDKSLDEIMGEYKDCISNYNGGVRNLGFAYVAKYLPDVQVIITLDDDTIPMGDTIAQHLDQLCRRVPVSWLSTAMDAYMRGFPYEIREEAEVVLSHGVWRGVADWDAPTQLVQGSRKIVDFYRGPIPKGIYYPMCGMNIAFKRKALPYMYQAPQALELNIGRADDIMCGILSKREIDREGWAVVTGYAEVYHERASNVFKNLRLEAATIELFEMVWQGKEDHPYFEVYRGKLEMWQDWLKTL